MGHADRPGQHHVVGLDAEPWRIRLPAVWSSHAHAHANADLIPDGDANRDRNSHSHCNGDSYSNSNIDAQDNAHTAITANVQAAPNTTTSPVGLVPSRA